MEAERNKYTAEKIAEQRAKVEGTRASHKQHEEAGGYHKEAANHRALIADLEDIQPEEPVLNQVLQHKGKAQAS